MVEVISGGFYSSIQDLGRFGFRRYGIPLSGVMDRYSAGLANRLVGNAIQNAIMEVTTIGPVLRFTSNTVIAITGAGFKPSLNGVEIVRNSRIYVEKDAVLKFGRATYGLWGYLSVLGGFDSENKLGSRSQYFGITEKEKIEKGAIIATHLYKGKTYKATSSIKEPQDFFSSNSIDVFKGPDFNLLPASLQNKLLETELTVSSQSNRMAYGMSGWEKFSAKEIITAPVQPGTVQLTPSGQCLVLMRDAQTTGGYSRVLQLTANSINKLSQKRAGTILHCKLVPLP